MKFRWVNLCNDIKKENRRHLMYCMMKELWCMLVTITHVIIVVDQVQQHSPTILNIGTNYL